jgi:hypothetical protein
MRGGAGLGSATHYSYSVTVVSRGRAAYDNCLSIASLGSVQQGARVFQLAAGRAGGLIRTAIGWLALGACVDPLLAKPISVSIAAAAPSEPVTSASNRDNAGLPA